MYISQFPWERTLTKIKNVEGLYTRSLPSVDIKELTMKSAMAVTNVQKLTQRSQILLYIREHTRERNLTNVDSVEKPTPVVHPSVDMSENRIIPRRNFMNVKNVQNHSAGSHPSLFIKAFTKQRKLINLKKIEKLFHENLTSLFITNHAKRIAVVECEGKLNYKSQVTVHQRTSEISCEESHIEHFRIHTGKRGE